MGVGKCIQGLVGKPQGRRPLGSPRRGWSLILTLLLNKSDAKVRTGFIWLRILTRGHYALQ